MNILQITNYKLQITIFIVAVFLLFFDLGGRDYWSDEIFSLPKIANPQVVLAQSSWDVHPPLFFILEYYWIELIGKSESATRALPALCGLVAIFLTLAIAKRKIPQNNLSIFLFTLATSPFLLFYARMARYYTLTGVLCLWVILNFDLLLEKNGGKQLFLYWLSVLLLLYEDYIGFILLFSLSLYYLWRYRTLPKAMFKYLLGAVVVFILYLPWIGNLLYRTGTGAMPYPEPEGVKEFRLIGFIASNLVQSVLRLGYALYNFTLGETVFPWNPLIIMGLLGSAILFIFALKNIRAQKDFWIYALFFPFAIYIFSVIFYSKVFSAANFALLPSKMLFLQPLWLMFLFSGRPAKNGWRVAGGILLIGFNLCSNVNYHWKTEHLNPKYIAPWREIAQDIASRSTANDIVITDEETLAHYLKGSNLKIYGLVDADKFIAEQKPPFKIHLVLRHRGEGSIYGEGVKIKQIFDDNYGAPQFIGWMKLKGIHKKMWNKILGEDFEYYVEEYVYKI